jgi:hypothetical protein
MKATIEKLDRPEQCGDWHDKPMRYVVKGLPELQKFSTKKAAQQWASLRPKFASFNETFHASMKQAGIYA